MNDSTNESLTQLIDNSLEALMEHFEAVQILATTHDSISGDTYDWMRGSGNWYARRGLADNFISKDKAQDIGVEVANRLPSDGDDWQNG